jgi:hypothetical protein
MMYPAPVRTEVETFGLVVGAATKGFEIFNQIKGMLPEGMMKNLKIPGLPKGMQAQVKNLVGKFNDAKGMID